MDFIDLLRLQIRDHFSGKVHLAYSDTKQFLGEVWFHRGKPIYAKYHHYLGPQALSHAYIESRQGRGFSFLCENEIVDLEKRNIFMDPDQLLERVYFHYRLYKKNLAKKPPSDLIIKLNQSVLQKQSADSIGEKYMLGLLDNFQSVSDIYQNSDLLEWETTEALINLKKKKMISVYKH